MVIVDDLKALNGPQRAAFFASFLAWSLDAFDFFLLTFILKNVADEFHTAISNVAAAIVLTLAARPLGAFVFGRLADRHGRRPILMLVVVLYSVLALASAFSPNLNVLLALRFLFGFAMGGVWGIGASLALESIPVKSRGVVSGILQEGYPTGFFLAALANLALPFIGWRVLLGLGVLPALLVFYIERRVEESASWQATSAKHKAKGAFLRSADGLWTVLATAFVAAVFAYLVANGLRDINAAVAQAQAVVLGIDWRVLIALGVLAAGLIFYCSRRAGKGGWPLLIYVVVLMTCFNFFSHGTQDLYPTFLKVQHKFDAGTVTALTMVLNLGAMVGGLIFGALSERIGRRRAMVLAALLALPIIPLWAFSSTPLLLGLGAFLIQIAVQGAWGVVPVHLNELSPEGARGTFPGLAYQLGNLLAAVNATVQARIAETHGNNYGLALAIVCAVVAVVLSVITWFGPEAKGVSFSG